MSCTRELPSSLHRAAVIIVAATGPVVA